MERFSVDICHEKLLETRKPLLAFDENAPFEPWRQAVKEKLTELLGDMPERVPLNIQIEEKVEHDTYTETIFTFDTEADTVVPCHLLVPKTGKASYPVIICLQGHSTGMHISMGRRIYPSDFDLGKNDAVLPTDRDFPGDRDYAIQAVERGYATLVMDQRGLGKRASEKSTPNVPVLKEWAAYDRTGCFYPSMCALLLGRTMIGERVWDISRSIDAMSEFPELDTERVACLGNSGGGTATYYAACMDERIKVAVPSCAVCSFDQSIGIMRHCSCNYIPGIAKYFDMGELSALIAPRKLIMVSGEKDHGFYIKGSKECYDVIEKVYEKAGCADNCTLVVGTEGHRFYADPTWDIFDKLTGWND